MRVSPLGVMRHVARFAGAIGVESGTLVPRPARLFEVAVLADVNARARR